jgi:hypothetical protein
LALIHFPVAGVFFSLLFLGAAIAKREFFPSRLALGFVVLTGLSGGAAFLTGEQAAEVAERVPETSGGWIHTHEEAAEAGALALGVTAVLALGGLVLLRVPGRSDRGILKAVFLLTALTAALLGRAAHFGGLIRHTEIRPPLVDGQGGPSGDNVPK